MHGALRVGPCGTVVHAEAVCPPRKAAHAARPLLRLPYENIGGFLLSTSGLWTDSSGLKVGLRRISIGS